jgi:hypothetical protein
MTLTSKVEQMTPKAMPNAPSISCAAKPMRMKGATACQSIEAIHSSMAKHLHVDPSIA